MHCGSSESLCKQWEIKPQAMTHLEGSDFLVLLLQLLLSCSQLTALLRQLTVRP